jgi:hypothetical protein
VICWPNRSCTGEIRPAWSRDGPAGRLQPEGELGVGAGGGGPAGPAWVGAAAPDGQWLTDEQAAGGGGAVVARAGGAGLAGAAAGDGGEGAAGARARLAEPRWQSTKKLRIL